MPDVTIYDEHHRPLIGVEVEEYSLDTGGTIALATSSLSGIASFPDTSLDVHFRPRLTRRSGKVGELSHNGLVEIHRPLPVVETPIEETPSEWGFNPWNFAGGDFADLMEALSIFVGHYAIWLVWSQSPLVAVDIAVQEIAPAFNCTTASYDLVGNPTGVYPDNFITVYAVWRTGPHPSLLGVTGLQAMSISGGVRGPGAQAHPIVATNSVTARDDAYLAADATIGLSLACAPQNAVAFLAPGTRFGVIGEFEGFGLPQVVQGGPPYCDGGGGKGLEKTDPFGFYIHHDHFLGQANTYAFNMGACTIRRNF